MSRDGVLRAVLVPAAISTVVMAALLVCLLRALAASRFAPDLAGGYGGISAAVVVGIMTSVADRRSLKQAKDRLPPGLSPTQRDEVLSAARSGPLPPDPLVRAEARRLAEQRAAVRGNRPCTTAAVFVSSSTACALAGAIWSPWWWGDALVLAAVAALILRRDRRLRQHLHTLRREVPLPPPAGSGVHRLLDADQRPDLVSANLSLLDLDLRKPWGATTSPPVVRIDGRLVTSEWGRNEYLLPAGSVAVSVSSQYLTEYGRASTTVAAAAGDRTALHYASPALTMLDGRIGPQPQRSPGQRGVVAFVLAFAGLLVVLMIIDP